MFKLETVQEQAQILQDICINAMDNFSQKKKFYSLVMMKHGLVQESKVKFKKEKENF